MQLFKSLGIIFVIENTRALACNLFFTVTM